MKSIQAFIAELTATKERTTAPEIAAILVDYAREELGVEPGAYDQASVAKPIMWRGATQYARDAIKHVRSLESILNGGDEQNELFDPGFGEFVWIGGEESTFVRRRALTQGEYITALGLLKQTSDRLIAKIDRYERDYHTALPHFSAGVTFAEAYRLASEQA